MTSAGGTGLGCAGSGWRSIATNCASVLEHWRRVESGVAGEGVSFLEGLRAAGRGQARLRRSDALLVETPRVERTNRRRTAAQDAGPASSPARDGGVDFDPGEHLRGAVAAVDLATGVKVALAAAGTRARCVSGRRHGAGQDDPGHRPPLAAQAPWQTRTRTGLRSSSRRPHCWRIGKMSWPASRRASAPAFVHPSETPVERVARWTVTRRRSFSPTKTWY